VAATRFKRCNCILAHLLAPVQYINCNKAKKERKMLHIDEIRAALQFMVLSDVAEATGVNRNTLAQIKRGESRNPSHKSIVALSVFIKGLTNAE
jgi:transcriptional regulator with XRE-family HTH domain